MWLGNNFLFQITVMMDATTNGSKYLPVKYEYKYKYLGHKYKYCETVLGVLLEYKYKYQVLHHCNWQARAVHSNTEIHPSYIILTYYKHMRPERLIERNGEG